MNNKFECHFWLTSSLKKKKIIRNFYCSHGDRIAAKINLLVYNLSMERQTSVDLF